jgi:glycosyltransferase involved in cell wall biosynthesis
MPTLSVIVPCRNAEPYLSACLDSLAAQTRPIDEVLLVEDGSTDGSAQTLARYAGKHPSFRILDGPRAGAAGARNTGLEAARGDWIGFADADDWLEPRMYERLLGLALEHDLDMALCNARYHYEGRKPDHALYDEAPAGPMSGGEWLTRKLESRKFLHAVWNHLYRRAFIEEQRLRFPVGLFHEDVTWTTRALVAAKRVAYDSAQLYVYRRQPRRAGTAAERDDHLLHVIEGAKTDARLLAEIADASSDERLSRAIRWQLVDGGLSVFHKIRQLSSPDLRRTQWRATLSEGYLRLLWRNAPELGQRRKIASRYVKALIY